MGTAVKREGGPRGCLGSNEGSCWWPQGNGDRQGDTGLEVSTSRGLRDAGTLRWSCPQNGEEKGEGEAGSGSRNP